MKTIKKYHVVIYISIIICALIVIFINVLDYKKSKSIKIIRKPIIEEETPIKDNIPTIDFEKLRKKYKNKDIKGAIRIKNDSFEEIVFQTNNNTYYLNHDYRKKKVSGEIFLDSELNIDKSKIKLIYGNASNKSIIFKKYFDEQYYINHKYIELETEKEIYKYEVMLVYSGNISYESFDSQKILDNSLYTYNVDFNNNDDFLIYSTIIDNKQISIVCKKVS